MKLGDGGQQWVGWAKGAADRARLGLAQAAEKANAADLGSVVGKVTENASKAGAVLGEKAGHASGQLRSGVSGVGAGLTGLSSMAMSPVKLAQSAGIFMLGFMLISLSFSFLPMLPLQPQKFALLFAMGSVCMLGSVAWLKGPGPFASAMLQRDKAPFTVVYCVGVLGSFWATLIARSYLYTGVFALLQAVGLAYFVASFVPGGQRLLSFIGRLFGRCSRLVVGGAIGGR